MKEIFNATAVKPVLDQGKRRSFDPTLGYSPYWEDPWYLEFRRRIQEQQVKDNTSSVYWKTVSILGETIRFPTYFEELAFMPQDLEILRRWKFRTVLKFLAAKERLGMAFLEDVGPDSLPDNFLALVNLADHATISEDGPSDSVVWTPDGPQRLHNTVHRFLTLTLYSLPPVPIEELEKTEDHCPPSYDFWVCRQYDKAYLPEPTGAR